MPASCHLLGQRFGRLTVVGREPRGTSKRARWHCQCDCGGGTLVASNVLNAGRSQSCGCLQRERAGAAARINNRTHGMKKSPEHYTWVGMLTRCRNPNATGYERYGGLGVTVCERWLRFENFYADMGQRPTLDHTLDRYPDKHGNYEPTNCRWATREEQQANRRDMIDGRRVRNWQEMRAAS